MRIFIETLKVTLTLTLDLVSLANQDDFRVEVGVRVILSQCCNYCNVQILVNSTY